MMVAAPPISGNQNSQDLMRMSATKSLLWYDDPIPEECKDLIYKLLAPEPRERITASEILQHPFMKEGDEKRCVSDQDSTQNAPQSGTHPDPEPVAEPVAEREPEYKADPQIQNEAESKSEAKSKANS